MRLLREIRNLMGSYHVKSGIYHYYRNEFKQAVDFFRRALSEGAALPESERRTARYYLTETFLGSAERLERKGDLDAAARDYERAGEVAPTYPDIRFRLGRVLERLGRSAEAIEQYRQAIACNEDYLDARIALAFCLLHAGRHEEAAAVFELARDRKIRQIHHPCEEGFDRLREGKIGEAEELFHAAFLKFPHRFEDRYRSALEHLKAEEYDEALEQLDQAILLDAKFPDLHNFRGVALCELGRVEEGIEAFRRAIELKQGYQVAQLNLAFAHLRAGRIKEAEGQLAAVLEADPSQPAASIKLAELSTGRVPETRRPVQRGGSR